MEDVKAGEYTVRLSLTDHQAGIVNGMLLHAEIGNVRGKPGAVFSQVIQEEGGE